MNHNDTQYWKSLEERYFAGTATDEEERLLLQFAATTSDPAFRPLQAVLGLVCVVTDRIDNFASRGTVWADGKSWSARSVDGEMIEKDARVLVRSIEGVKLIVEKAE